MFNSRSWNSFAITALIVVCVAASASAQWEWMEGPSGGTVNSFFVSDDGTIYASTPLAGVYRSTDDGASWVATVFTGGSEPILAQSPSGTMYMVDNFTNGIYMSDDHFTSYSMFTGPDGGGNLESVYAFSDDVLVVAGRFSGSLRFYRTTDGGSNWSETFDAGVQAFFPIYIEMDAGLYVAFELVATPRFTDDMGATWTDMPNPGGGGGVNPLIITDQGTLLAGNANNLQRSTDGGNTWAEISPGLAGFATILAQATDGTVYVRSTFNSLMSSTDDGQNWSAVDNDLPDGDSYFALVGTPSRLLMGGEYGVHASSDGGATWGWSHEGLVATTPLWVVGHSSGSVLASHGYLQGLNIRNAAGTWSYDEEKGPAVAINETGDIYTTYGNSLWNSTDGGATWGWPGGLTDEPFSFSVLNSPGADIYALSQTNTLYQSTDNGTSFAALSPVGVKDLAWDNEGTLYITTAFNGFQVSTDNGATWTTTDPGAPLEEVDIAPDGTLYRRNAQLVQRSDDGGNNWESIHTTAISDTIQFPGFTINALGVDNEGTVYMDMEWFSNWPEQLRGSGVYVSNNQGTSWSHMDEWRASVFSMGLDGYMYAGTSRGVYRVMSGADVHEASTWEPVNFALEQNYPNPFNPTTEIRFSLTAPGHTELQVFDITGRRVSTLTSEHLGVGAHTVSFDASRLASGTYLYRLTHPQGSEVRRMTVVK